MKISDYPWKNKTVICNRVSYTTETFVSLCIDAGSAAALAKQLGCARTTVNSSIKKYFPELPRGNSSIRTKFLSLLNLKHCPKCLNNKKIEEFRKNKTCVDGLSSYCIACQKALDREYYIKNKEKKKEYQSKYCKENLLANRGKNAKYRASKLQRTPSWADLEKIKEIYNNCPEGCHVDHIIPLQGDKVSGLHVPENLQYLKAEDNLKKSNSFNIT